MISIKDSSYADLILKQLNFSFGSVFLLEDIILSELHHGEVLDSDKALMALEEVLLFYEEKHVVKKRLWISNRTEVYSTKLIGWIELREVAQEYFYGFCIVNDRKSGIVSALLEFRFVPIAFKNVKIFDKAFAWDEQLKASDT